jgi:hypothetical protein
MTYCIGKMYEQAECSRGFLAGLPIGWDNILL